VHHLGEHRAWNMYIIFVKNKNATFFWDIVGKVSSFVPDNCYYVTVKLGVRIKHANINTKFPTNQNVGTLLNLYSIVSGIRDNECRDVP